MTGVDSFNGLVPIDIIPRMRAPVPLVNRFIRVSAYNVKGGRWMIGSAERVTAVSTNSKHA